MESMLSIALDHMEYTAFPASGSWESIVKIVYKMRKDGVNFKVTDKVVPTIDRALGHLAVVLWAGQQPGKVQRKEADSLVPQKSSSGD